MEMTKDPREMALDAVRDALGMGKMKSVLGDDFGAPVKKGGVTIIVVKGDKNEEVEMPDEMGDEMPEMEDDEEEGGLKSRLASLGE